MIIRGNLIAALLMLFFFAGMCYFSLDWPEKARGFPLLIAIVGISFSAIQVISELMKIKRVGSETSAKNDRLPAGTSAMLFWVAFLFGAMIIFGFWVGSIFFMVTFMRFFGHESWKTTISITSILVATLYLALSVVMKIPIYGGILGLTPY